MGRWRNAILWYVSGAIFYLWDHYFFPDRTCYLKNDFQSWIKSDSMTSKQWFLNLDYTLQSMESFKKNSDMWFLPPEVLGLIGLRYGLGIGILKDPQVILTCNQAGLALW